METEPPVEVAEADAEAEVKTPPKNTVAEDICHDVSDRRDWAAKDSEIIKRRLGERRKKRTKPYVGAPNGIVPIIDDVTTEKTDQEVTMMMNAPIMAVFVPLDQQAAANRGKAERAFDTYLRHICRARPKIEESLDTKNARGWSVLKVFRCQHEEWGEIPDFDSIDPRHFIVPSMTKELSKSERLVEVMVFNSEREFRDEAKRRGWKNVDAVVEQAMDKERHKEERDTIDETMHLVGLTTNGTNTEQIIVWSAWYYADEWAVYHDMTGELEKGRKCNAIFSPDARDIPLKVIAHKDPDIQQQIPLTEQELYAEAVNALADGRAPSMFRIEIIPGKDRPWPYIQPRSEYRSRYFYDSRGIGHRCMDDQIFATGMLNAKMTMVDFVSQPMFENDGTDNSGNFTAEPGAVMPRGLKFASPPQVPSQLDFGIDYHKREAARRAGAGSQYNYSDQVAESRKIQKTATEVQQESARVAQVSSASVDRFNDPWRELFSLLWEDLRRMKKPLPMIANETFVGMATEEIYAGKFLIIPAASAKTLHPDMQFQRAKGVVDWLTSMVKLGVPVDFASAVSKALDYYDPFFKDTALIDPAKTGPQGQPPIYQAMMQMSQQMQGHEAAIRGLADIVDGKGNPNAAPPAQAPAPRA